MALKEISALDSLPTVDDTTFLHVKHGGVDYKIIPQTLFDLYNSQTAGNEDNRAVTKAEVGLGTVTDNPQLKIASNLGDVQSASASRTNLSVDSSAEVTSKVSAHANLTNDPHNVTKAQVGLGNVPNYTITSNIADTSTTKFATINAVAQVNAKVNALTPNVIPTGAIVMWSTTAAIPAGWIIMDGTNGTIDMRGKFVRGGSLTPGDTQVGQTGGSDANTHTHSGTAAGTALTTTQIPAHSHQNGTRYERADNGGREVEVLFHDPDFNREAYQTGLAGGPTNALEGVADAHGHSVSVAANAVVAKSNLPTYYTMVYIQKT